MSSDESAKPHPAHKDRNPFDISRRSEEEVAAEIAARLSAWKQARSRNGGTTPSQPSRPPQTAHTMVTPGMTSGVMSGTVNRGNPAAGVHPSGAHAFGTQRMPRFGEFAEPAERTAVPRPIEQRPIEQRPVEQPPIEQRATDRGIDPALPVVAGPGALFRAVPAAPSFGRPTRAFLFRAGNQRPAKATAANPETPNPEPQSATSQSIEIEPSAEIETPHVDSAPADASALSQIAPEPIAPEPIAADPPVDVARSRSIPAPVIETWEDEEAAIAAAGIPRLEIPERVTVPMAGRHAARGGTGWAMSLGAVLLFLGVTLPAALWQQSSDQATIAVAVTPPATTQAVTAPEMSAPSAPASGALMEMTESSEPAAPSVASSAPAPFGAIAEQKMQHAFAPYEALHSLQAGREIAAAPINMPTAAGPGETSDLAEARTGAEPGTFPAAPFPQAARPFIPNAGPNTVWAANPAHVLVAPPGAVKKPAARLKPVASAAVSPATKAAKPAAQKPKVVKPASPGNAIPGKATVEQMFDQLIKTLSNGQPPNPATQPVPPGTRR